MGKWLKERGEWLFMCFLFWLASWHPAQDDDKERKK